MKGILFKPESIKSILEGRKTQTRRLAGLKVINQKPYKWQFIGADTELPDYFVFRATPEIKLLKPRYQVGEVVYIKEAWATEERMDSKPPSFLDKAGDVPLWYRADYSPTTRAVGDKLDYVVRGRWRSPMMMPEWAARYFIEITGVRAER